METFHGSGQTSQPDKLTNGDMYAALCLEQDNGYKSTESKNGLLLRCNANGSSSGHTPTVAPAINELDLPC